MDEMGPFILGIRMALASPMTDLSTLMTLVLPNGHAELFRIPLDEDSLPPPPYPLPRPHLAL
jgi:hypothetical protein